MANHKWTNGKCVRCGITREKRTRSTRMAIVNHPPWEVWHHEFIYKYFLKNGTETWQRPECIQSKSNGK